MSYTPQEIEVLNRYGLDSFRNIKASQFVQLASDLKDMDREVACGIIQQIPNFLNLAKDALTEQCDLARKAMDDSKEETLAIFRQCEVLIEVLNEQINNPNNTVQEKLDLSDKITEVILLMDARKDKDNEHVEKIMKIVGSVAFGLVAAIGGIVGLKMNLPNNSDPSDFID